MDLSGCRIVDLQVNGGGGILFNDRPTLAAIATIYEAHKRNGTNGIFPTFITDDKDKMYQAIAAVKEGLDLGLEGLLGIHLEGPFISVEKAGAHARNYIRSITIEDIERIVDMPRGAVIVTLAPENVDCKSITRLVDGGAIVSLGHTNCTYEQAMAAFDAGASMVTHLFNAMSQMEGRRPGLVGAAMAREDVSCGIIVDGHHVHYGSVRAAYEAKGPFNLFLVSDGMPCVGSDVDFFDLNGSKIIVSNGACAMEDGTLAGSNITVNTALWNCLSECCIPLHDAMIMANPVHLLRKRKQ